RVSLGSHPGTHAGPDGTPGMDAGDCPGVAVRAVRPGRPADAAGRPVELCPGLDHPRPHWWVPGPVARRVPLNPGRHSVARTAHKMDRILYLTNPRAHKITE